MGIFVSSVISLLSMLAVDLAHMAFIVLSYNLSTLTLFRVININGWWILSNAFLTSIEMIIWFLPFILLICSSTMIDLQILKPGINPTYVNDPLNVLPHSPIILLLIFCWELLHLCSLGILVYNFFSGGILVLFW